MNVQNPTLKNNAFNPTTDKRDSGIEFIKNNFYEKFDIPVFQGKVTSVQWQENWHIMYKNMKSIKHTFTRKKSSVNLKLKEKYKLLSRSKPHKFVVLRLPLFKPKQGLFLDKPKWSKFEILFGEKTINNDIKKIKAP